MNANGFESVVLEDAPCPNGCEQDDEFVLVTRDFLSGLPGEFTIVRCKQCALMRTNPRPTAGTIGFYYPDDYGPYAGTMVSKNSESKQPKWKRWLKQLLSTGSTILPKIDPGRMLEIGCASGSFLYEMEKAGWHVEGIEFSEKAAANARTLGYKVHTGALESAPSPDKKFDLITAWMVLEHLHEPVLSLEKLNTWTVRNGYLAFSVPDVSSLACKLTKKYSYDFHIPNHLYHFTPDTVTALLEKTGWRVEKISHQKTISSFLASIGYWLRGTRGESKLSRWLLAYPTRGGNLHHVFFPFAYLLAKFGQTGRMTVWARKID